MSLATALGAVVEAFRRLGIAYLIGGSVASSAHGTPRSTLDVDLVADLRSEHVEPLCATLRGGFYAEPELVRQAIARRACVHFLHLDSGYKVDVFVLGESDYDRLAFTRTVERRLPGDPQGRLFRMATAEDVLLRKLLRYRSGDEVSDRQWHDILGVLRVQMATSTMRTSNAGRRNCASTTCWRAPNGLSPRRSPPAPHSRARLLTRAVRSVESAAEARPA